ncbi:MAG TPA: CDP-alcohol phosphatidyltransferase family protein [Candidatus Binatia bacterium]|nr:CDP-alcohol phosphatidyltransferase family protein [Candidatus Binatia bacterium]
MPSIYQIKPAFQGLLRPIVRRLAAIGVTANQVTLGAALLSIAAGILIAAAQPSGRIWFLLPAVLFLRMALNAIDGMLAREHGQKSALGAFLNELCDVVSDAALYLPFALLDLEPAVVVIVVLLAGLSEMAGVVAIQVGADRRYDGPMGKSDRAFAFGLLGFLLGCGVPAGLWMTLVIAALGLLIVVTIANRMRQALHQVKGR